MPQLSAAALGVTPFRHGAVEELGCQRRVASLCGTYGSERPLKMPPSGCQDDSAAKGAPCLCWKLAFNPWTHMVEEENGLPQPVL